MGFGSMLLKDFFHIDFDGHKATFVFFIHHEGKRGYGGHKLNDSFAEINERI
jgi:hypothetical protein